THIYFSSFTVSQTTHISTLSLHDALPISAAKLAPVGRMHAKTMPGSSLARAQWKNSRFAGLRHQDGRSRGVAAFEVLVRLHGVLDRKSTRLNSSHSQISYAVFCLKKKRTR